MMCIECGEDAIVVYRGFSLCREHLGKFVEKEGIAQKPCETIQKARVKSESLGFIA